MNLEDQYKNIIKNLDERIKNKEDLEYIKSEMVTLFMSFFNEVYLLRELYEARMGAICDKQAYFEEKIEKLGNSIDKIEKDFYMDDQISDLRIVCPYCANDCFIEIENLHDNGEMECPECKNIIELDWDEDDSDCGCSGCTGDCHCEEDDML
ncbi:MAG: hypothetical protein FWF46_04240 [Oscillospiraceae bacterium]|nr:hypothetical protein [Oscillospiraceae bacterium]